MFHHLNTNRWDLHINQPRCESCIKHVCCISRMNFYRSDFKHKIYGLYTGKYGRCFTVQPDCLKGWVVCGTVYGDMHLKGLLGSIVRVGYRIPVPDFYLVLHGLRCRKSTITD